MDAVRLRCGALGMLAFYVVCWLAIMAAGFYADAICKMSADLKLKGTAVDCHGQNWRHVPRNLPGDTVRLDMSENQLKMLTNGSFSQLSNLVILNLSRCNLSYIESEAFQGLENLQELYMGYNILKLDSSTYPEGVFLPVPFLITLDLSCNDDRAEGDTPDHIFKHLPNLKTLALDTFYNETFGPGFRNMKRLRALILGNSNDQFCAIDRLQNDTFAIFENSTLEELDLYNCNLDLIEAGVFSPLKYISKIRFSKTRSVPIQQGIQSFYGLNGKRVKKVKFDQLFSPSLVPASLDKQLILQKTLIFLDDICIEYLDLSQNIILFIEIGFIGKLSRCIKHLDLSRNSIFGQLIILFELERCDFLEYFDISHQQRFDKVTEDYMEEEYDEKYTRSNPSPKISMSLPKNIRTIKMCSIALGSYKLSDISFSGGKLLELFDVSNNGFSEGVSQVKGLSHVGAVNLSGNDGSGMTSEFISSFKHVKTLYLNRLNLDQSSILKGNVSSGLKNLTDLTALFLRNNHLRFLDKQMFANMKQLKSLGFADNNFVTVPFHLSTVPSLQFLDLSVNSVTYLYKEKTDIMDTLAEKHGFELHLRGNPLSCSCTSLDFIHWLFTTNVKLDIGGNYTCVGDDGILRYTADVNANYMFYWTHCQSRVWLPVAISLFLLGFLLIVSTMLVSWNWRRIQFRLLVMLGKGIEKVSRADFEKDVYVAHSTWEEDMSFVHDSVRVGLEMYLLKLILPERDFLGGQYKHDLVVQSINTSWKTLLIITKDFLREPLSHFIMRTVAYSVTHLNPNRIIILLIGDVRVPEAVIHVTEEEDIFHVDDFPGRGDNVWKAIKDRIVAEAYQ